MYRKFIGYAIVAVVLVSSIGIFSGTGEFFGNNSITTPASEMEGKRTSKATSPNDSTSKEYAMTLPGMLNDQAGRRSSSPVESKRSSKSSTQSAGQKPKFKSVLTSEERLIVRDGTGENSEALYLDTSQAVPILSDDDAFSKSMEDFLSDELESADAMDLANAYRDIFEGFGKEQSDGAFNLQNLSCGHSICLGSVRAESSNGTWRNFLDYLNSDGSAIHVFTENSIPFGDDIIEHRFFFSTDPRLIGAVLWPNG